MQQIGLTGGIGSGKTELAHLLARRGVPLLDLDAIGRKLHRNAEVAAELVASFGSVILDETGEVDRRKLAAHCFSDVERTKTLNGIMHPRIWACEAVWLAGQQAPYVLIEASVLIESGAASRMDAVVVVLAEEALRRQRVLASRDMDVAQFNAIVARQCSDKERRAVADYVIENNASHAALEQRAEQLHGWLLKRAAAA